MRFYFGTPGWGWKLYGIGYRARWFIGFSVRLESPIEDVLRDALMGGIGFARVDPSAVFEESPCNTAARAKDPKKWQ